MDEIMTNANQLADIELQQVQLSDGQFQIALAVILVISLCICFFGLKIVRVLATISGILVGALIGALVVSVAGLSGIAAGAVVIGCGVVLAVLGAVLIKVGIFLWGVTAVFGVAAGFFAPYDSFVLIICLCIGIVVGIVSVILSEPLVIIVSAVAGGISAGEMIIALFGLEDQLLIGLGIIIVLVVLGIVLQFMMHSRKIGKKEKEYAMEYKEMSSREAEVERMRKTLGDDDEDDI